MRTPRLVIAALVALALLAVPTFLQDAEASRLAPLIVAALCAAVVSGVWPLVTGAPSATATSVVLVLAGTASLASVHYSDDASPLWWWIPCVAVGTLALFVVQLLRGTGAAGKIPGLASGVSGLLVVTSCAGWLAVSRPGSLLMTFAGEQTLQAVLIGAAVGLLVLLLPLPTGLRAVAATLVAGGAAAAAAQWWLVAQPLTAGVLAAILSLCVGVAAALVAPESPADGADGARIADDGRDADAGQDATPNDVPQPGVARGSDDSALRQLGAGFAAVAAAGIPLALVVQPLLL